MNTLDCLIVGGDSLIGGALGKSLEAAGHKVLGTTRRKDLVGERRIFLDLSSPAERWPQLPEIDVWVLAAAVTRLEDCRKDPVGSRRVNVDGIIELANRAMAQNVHLLFLSTDQVFDGRVPHREAESVPCPKSVYGSQKVEAERAVLGLDGNTGIIRFTKVLDRQDMLFQGWIHALRHEEGVDAFSDKMMAPVPLETAVDALVLGIERRITGILQVSGPSDISYADAAFHFASMLGVNPGLVHPTRAQDAGLPPEDTPSHTTLDTRRLNEEFGFYIPEALDALNKLFSLPNN